MRELQTKKINDNEYTVTQLQATKATTLLTFLIKKLAPLLTAVLELKKQSNADLLNSKLTPEVLEQLTAAIMGLSEDDIMKIINTLIPTTRVNGVELKGIYELHFSGKMKEQFEWLTFALQTQYSDFFA